MHPVSLLDIKRVQPRLCTQTLDSAVLQTNFDFTFDFYKWHIQKIDVCRQDFLTCQGFFWNIFNLFALRHFLADPVTSEQTVWVDERAHDEIRTCLSETQIEMHL